MNETKIYEVDGPPGAGLGTAAEVGDIAIDGLTGIVYNKKTILNTGWKRLQDELLNLQASAATTITTTSTADVLATGMTLTPEAGEYLVYFQGAIRHGTNNVSSFVSVYSGGTQIANSETIYNRGNNNNNSIVPVLISGVKAVVDGSQAIEIRWRTTSGTATLNGNRYMSIIKVN